MEAVFGLVSFTALFLEFCAVPEYKSGTLSQACNAFPAGRGCCPSRFFFCHDGTCTEATLTIEAEVLALGSKARTVRSLLCMSTPNETRFADTSD